MQKLIINFVRDRNSNHDHLHQYGTTTRANNYFSTNLSPCTNESDFHDQPIVPLLHAVFARYYETEMPIYEFKCRVCTQKFDLLLGINDDPTHESCPHCGKKNHTKLVSKFRRLRSEDDKIDHIADELEGMDQPDSVSQMRNYIKEMGRATDDDMSEELEEMFESDLENDSQGDPIE